MALKGSGRSLHAEWDGRDDARLVELLVEGDREAFNELARRHFDVVHRVAWRVSGDAAEAEDLAQEAFLRLWRRPGTLREGQAVAAWLKRVAANLAIDRLRRARFEPDDEPQDVEDDAAGPEQDLLRADLEQEIGRALARLPERQRIALSLTYFEGFGNRDTAEMLDLTVEAVESLLARARRRLKNELADRWRDMLSDFERF